MQKVSQQFQVSSSCFRSHKTLIYLSTRVNHSETNRFLMHQLVCFGDVRHDKKTNKSTKISNKFPSRTGHDRVHSVIYLRETCPPLRSSNFFFCVIRLRFLRSSHYGTTRNWICDLHEVLFSFSPCFCLWIKAFLLVAERLLPRITSHKSHAAVEGQRKFCITAADNHSAITDEHSQSIKLPCNCFHDHRN